MPNSMHYLHSSRSHLQYLFRPFHSYIESGIPMCHVCATWNCMCLLSHLAALPRACRHLAEGLAGGSHRRRFSLIFPDAERNGKKKPAWLNPIFDCPLVVPYFFLQESWWRRRHCFELCSLCTWTSRGAGQQGGMGGFGATFIRPLVFVFAMKKLSLVTRPCGVFFFSGQKPIKHSDLMLFPSWIAFPSDWF